jgi:biotin operon repressor
MAAATAPVITLTPAELDDRRLAIENAIGTLRIEGMEIDAIPHRIFEQYAQGAISLDEMSLQIHNYTATIV